jgi:hypothetical protein
MHIAEELNITLGRLTPYKPSLSFLHIPNLQERVKRMDETI